MITLDYNKNPQLYAKLYSRLDIIGTQFLGFRDLPSIINQYVTGKKSLDYGCGGGKSTLYLKELGLDVEGVDINDKMIELAQQNDPKGIYKLIKSAQIPALDASYDFIFSSWVFMEVSTKEELHKITTEIHRVLKKDGIFIAVLCNEETYNNDWLTLNTQFDENKYLKSGSQVRMFFKDINLSIYDYFWTKEDYEQVINNGGLKLINTHHPLGKDDDGYNWINEKSKPSCTIYIAKKN